MQNGDSFAILWGLILLGAMVVLVFMHAFGGLVGYCRIGWSLEWERPPP
jgi:hypothetical protein